MRVTAAHSARGKVKRKTVWIWQYANIRYDVIIWIYLIQSVIVAALAVNHEEATVRKTIKFL